MKPVIIKHSATAHIHSLRSLLTWNSLHAGGKKGSDDQIRQPSRQPHAATHTLEIRNVCTPMCSTALCFQISGGYRRASAFQTVLRPATQFDSHPRPPHTLSTKDPSRAPGDFHRPAAYANSPSVWFSASSCVRPWSNTSRVTLITRYVRQTP